MTRDSAHETAQDTPASWQHVWKKAARSDPRMKTRHVAVVDAFAEFFYTQRSPRGIVWVSQATLMDWTKLGSRTVQKARADLEEWGWLVKVSNHGPGLTARHVLVVPEGMGITDEVIPKTCKSCTVEPSQPGAQTCKSCTLKAVKSAQDAHHPLPLDLPLPTPAPPTRIDQPRTAPVPRRGRQDDPPTKTPKTAVASRDELQRAIPPDVLASARGVRSAPTIAANLAAAIAAGWSPEQIRVELAGADAGANSTVAVIVSRLRGLAHTPAPVARPVSITVEQAYAQAHGRECAHGNPDTTGPTGQPWCPMCRRQAAAG